MPEPTPISAEMERLQREFCRITGLQPNERETMPVAKETSAPRDPIPEGSHHAVCYAVVDLGTQQPPQNSRFFAGPKRKVMLMFEVPGERIEVDRNGEKLDLPRAISKEFTLSLHEKSGLRKFLEAWRSKKFTADELAGFDLAVLAGMNCMLSVVHNDKGYADIASCMKLPKGMPAAQAENELIVYDIDKDVPGALPEWVRKKIDASEERHASNGNAYPHPPSETLGDDDIPF